MSESEPTIPQENGDLFRPSKRSRPNTGASHPGASYFPESLGQNEPDPSLGVGEFLAALSSDEPKRVLRALVRFVRVVKKQRWIALSIARQDDDPVREDYGSDEDDDDDSALGSGTEDQDAGGGGEGFRRKKYKKSESWKDDTANYNVPFVGTAVSSRLMNDSASSVVERGVWPTGLLKSYLQRSSLIFEFTSSDRLLSENLQTKLSAMGRDGTRLSRRLQKAYLRALREIATAHVEPCLQEKKGNPGYVRIPDEHAPYIAEILRRRLAEILGLVTEDTDGGRGKASAVGGCGDLASVALEVACTLCQSSVAAARFVYREFELLPDSVVTFLLREQPKRVSSETTHRDRARLQIFRLCSAFLEINDNVLWNMVTSEGMGEKRVGRGLLLSILSVGIRDFVPGRNASLDFAVSGIFKMILCSSDSVKSARWIALNTQSLENITFLAQGAPPLESESRTYEQVLELSDSEEGLTSSEVLGVFSRRLLFCLLAHPEFSSEILFSDDEKSIAKRSYALILCSIYESEPNFENYRFLKHCLERSPFLFWTFFDLLKFPETCSEFHWAFRLSFIRKLLSSNTFMESVLLETDDTSTDRRSIIPKSLKIKQISRAVQSTNPLLVHESVKYLVAVCTALENIRDSNRTPLFRTLCDAVLAGFPTASTLLSKASKMFSKSSRPLIPIIGVLAILFRKLYNTVPSFFPDKSSDLLKVFLPADTCAYFSFPLIVRIQILRLIERVLRDEVLSSPIEFLRPVLGILVGTSSSKEHTIVRNLSLRLLEVIHSEIYLRAGETNFGNESRFWIDGIESTSVDPFIGLLGDCLHLSVSDYMVHLKVLDSVGSGDFAAPISSVLWSYFAIHKKYHSEFRSLALCVAMKSLLSSSFPYLHAKCILKLLESTDESTIEDSEGSTSFFEGLIGLAHAILQTENNSVTQRTDGAAFILKHIGKREIVGRYNPGFSVQDNEDTQRSLLHYLLLLENDEHSCEEERRLLRLLGYSVPSLGLDHPRKVRVEDIHSVQHFWNYIVAWSRPQESSPILESTPPSHFRLGEACSVLSLTFAITFASLDCTNQIKIVEELCSSDDAIRDNVSMTNLYLLLAGIQEGPSPPNNMGTQMCTILFRILRVALSTDSEGSIVILVQNILLRLIKNKPFESAFARETRLTRNRPVFDSALKTIERNCDFMVCFLQYCPLSYLSEVFQLMEESTTRLAERMQSGSLDALIHMLLSTLEMPSAYDGEKRTWTFVQKRLFWGLSEDFLPGNFLLVLHDASLNDSIINCTEKDFADRLFSKLDEKAITNVESLFVFGLQFTVFNKSIPPRIREAQLEKLVSKFCRHLVVSLRSFSTSDSMSESFVALASVFVDVFRVERCAWKNRIFREWNCDKLVKALLRFTLDPDLFLSVSVQVHSLSASLIELLLITEKLRNIDFLAMVFSHSKIRILLGNQPKYGKCFEICQNTVLGLLKLCSVTYPSEQHHSVVNIITACYTASLSERDLSLRALLEDMVSDPGFPPRPLQALLWGDLLSCVTQDSGSRKVAFALPYAIKLKRVWATLGRFPFEDKCFGEKGIVSQSPPSFNPTEAYSPGFLLPFTLASLETILRDEKSSGDLKGFSKYSQQVVESGLLALSIAALCSTSSLLRGTAFAILYLLHEHGLNMDTKRWSPQVCLLLNSIQKSLAIRKSFSNKNTPLIPRVPVAAAIFLAKSSLVLLKPEHPLYPAINRYFLKSDVDGGAFSDFQRIPGFVSLFFTTSEERSIATREKMWAIETLSESMIENACIRAAISCHAFENLLSHFESPSSSSLDKTWILNVFERAVLCSSEQTFIWTTGFCSFIEAFLIQGDCEEEHLSKIIDIFVLIIECPGATFHLLSTILSSLQEILLICVGQQIPGLAKIFDNKFYLLASKERSEGFPKSFPVTIYFVSDKDYHDTDMLLLFKNFIRSNKNSTYEIQDILSKLKSSDESCQIRNRNHIIEILGMIETHPQKVPANIQRLWNDCALLPGLD